MPCPWHTYGREDAELAPGEGGICIQGITLGGSGTPKPQWTHVMIHHAPPSRGVGVGATRARGEEGYVPSSETDEIILQSSSSHLACYGGVGATGGVRPIRTTRAAEVDFR